MSKEKKFKDVWANQTAIGKKFGISSVEVGKILIEKQLKNKETKQATAKAINERYAKFTPLKDGTPHFMWNIEKTQQILQERYSMLSEVDYWVNEVKEILQNAERLLNDNEDKLAYLTYDYLYDDVPKHIRADVKFMVEKFID